MRLLKDTALALALWSLAGVAAADPNELIAMCEDCHGPNGVSAHSDVPTIAGQSSAYISKTLKSFQIWGRPCIKSTYRHGDTSRPRTDMCKIAEGLTGEDIAALGAHFSTQTFRPAQQPFDAGLTTRGAALHEERCDGCHQEGGAKTDRTPRIAGQWMPYLKTTLKFVPTGEHLVPPAMESVIAGLSEQDIDALMHYYASQQN